MVQSKTHYKKLTRERVRGFYENLKGRYYEKVSQLTISAYLSREPFSYEERMKGEYKSLKIGDTWGELFDCGWFHFEGIIPEICAGEKVVLLIDLSGEGCVYNDTGEPILGLTTGTVAYEYEPSAKRSVPVTEGAKGGESISLWIDAGMNDLFGRYPNQGKIVDAHIAVVDDLLRAYFYDLQVLEHALDEIDETSARFNSILYACNDSINEISRTNLNDQNALIKARAILAKELNKKGGDPSLKINAIGHAHIDLAWLWPLRETYRKGARTFSTVIEMMKRYPDYKFGASQPQLYQWMKDMYPSIYKDIKRLVKEGRWELQGAMWVEADTNVPSGESLVRQILYGQKFYKQEFGKKVNHLWLPDVFGYTAALPQILAKSGIEYFMTMKLSWSLINDFPYHTFNWYGIDGSQVKTHMLPEGNYNSSASLNPICKIEKNFKEKGLSEEVLMLFGIGNGGGGPASHHLERLARLKNFEGTVPVTQGFASDMFERIAGDYEKCPEWKGELYLERHQGTYTTQADNKKGNRVMEQLLRHVEYVSVLAEIYGGLAYPRSEIETIWKEVLLYQFHDILPGSSIKRVYDESVEAYGRLEKSAKELAVRAYKALSSQKDSQTVMNDMSFPRSGFIKNRDTWYTYDVPSFGFSRAEELDPKSEMTLKYGDGYIENSHLKVRFDGTGRLFSVFDKENRREILTSEGYGNQLLIYEDYGDAWDMDIHYLEKVPECFLIESSKTYRDGPNLIVETHYNYNKSSLVQKMFLTEASPVLTFETTVEWHEKDKMLRTAFDVDIMTDKVLCDIQYGHIARSTLNNTSWEAAQYEICAHHWIDMSENNYGVALLNNGKYGHRAKGSRMDINLLRSQNYPGKSADMGTHRFNYGLYPHRGTPLTSDLEEKGFAFNNQPFWFDQAVHGRVPESFLSVDQGNIIIDTVKKSEEDVGIIVRLYECNGTRTGCYVSLPSVVSQAVECNLLEEELKSLNVEKGGIYLDFKGFEIITVKLKF